MMKMPAALAKACLASFVTWMCSGSTAFTILLMQAAGGSKSVLASAAAGAAGATGAGADSGAAPSAAAPPEEGASALSISLTTQR